MVEEDVQKKLDIKYVEKELSNLDDDIAIIYVCVNDNWRKDDTWEKDDKKYYRILLPYDKVLKMKPLKVRQLMMKLAEKRLGLSSEKAVAA